VLLQNGETINNAANALITQVIACADSNTTATVTRFITTVFTVGFIKSTATQP